MREKESLTYSTIFWSLSWGWVFASLFSFVMFCNIQPPTIWCVSILWRPPYVRHAKCLCQCYWQEIRTFSFISSRKCSNLVVTYYLAWVTNVPYYMLNQISMEASLLGKVLWHGGCDPLFLEKKNKMCICGSDLTLLYLIFELQLYIEEEEEDTIPQQNLLPCPLIFTSHSATTFT